MTTLIKMAAKTSTLELGDNGKGSEKKQYVDLGLVVLVSVLIVIVIFIVNKCKLKCNSKREPYIRTSSANDTCGTGYGFMTPVDFAGCASEDIGWSDSPHFKANPQNWYLPLEEAHTDFSPTLRRMYQNFTNDSNSPLYPIYNEFSQYFEGERAPDFPKSGEISAGNPYTNNSTKSRISYNHRGNLSTSRDLNNHLNQGNITAFGPTWEDTLNLRIFDQLNNQAEAPNALINPDLAQDNKVMDSVIQRDLDLVL